MPRDGILFGGGARVVVAAHPDDETIGCGGVLPGLPGALVVHLTNGAPADGSDARAAGFASCQDYARARRAELLAAMRLAGIPAARLCEIGLTDQEAALHMADAAHRLARLFDERYAAVVFTHPYEGGHPDHDATAFAVHAACRLAAEPPAIVEFTSYHGRGGVMQIGHFLEEGANVVTLPLEDGARRLKRAMLDCFATQRRVLEPFAVDVERFRRAPEYDFTLPPHDGTLWYERFPWGMTGQRFRALAAGALEALGLEAHA